MSFVNAMDASPLNNLTVGEKGAPCLRSTNDKMLDLFAGLVRSATAADVDKLFNDALAAAVSIDDKADLVVLAMQTRACRNTGKGERALAYTLIKNIAVHLGSEVAATLLELMPVYGYFKDLSNLFSDASLPEPVRAKALTIFAEALETDAKALAAAEAAGEVPKLSLAGKYAPRESGKYDKLCDMASALAVKIFGGANKLSSKRKYRKMVSALNAALNTTEVLMASNRFAEINFAKVASLCLQRHRKAFLNEALKGSVPAAREDTGNRYPESADRIASRVHLRETMIKKNTINGKALMPHEIAAKCMISSCRTGSLSTAERDLMHAQWTSMKTSVQEALREAAEKRDTEMADAMAAQADAASGSTLSLETLKASLPKRVDLGKLVPLVDVSGSMHGQPMEVAIGLGILVAELTAPEFRDRCLTFESEPSWVDLSDCKTIHAKVQKMQSAPWGGSTNFEAACERILEAAVAAKLKPDEIPDMIVFSDMQFDTAAGGGFYGSRCGSWSTQFERLQKRFAEAGERICGEPYAAPRIIFWNLRSSVGFPVAKDSPNTQLLSGFSPALLKLVLTGAELVADEEEVTQADGTKVVVKKTGPTPQETLRKALDDDAFDPVRARLSALETGVFASYTFAKEDAGFELVDVC